jgi:hypothetical protein
MAEFGPIFAFEISDRVFVQIVQNDIQNLHMFVDWTKRKLAFYTKYIIELAIL